MREICQCNCFKECHNPHELDIHGGNCPHHPGCEIYTWKAFLYDDEELKKQQEKN